MQFKPEYITDELTSALNVLLSCRTDTVFEEYHVIHALRKCADELSQTILEQFVSLTPVQRVNPTYFQSFWYVHSNITMNSGINDSFITKEPSNHEIIFTFQKMSGFDMQNKLRELPYSESEIEQLRQQAFNDELKEDNLVIIVNPDFMRWILQDRSGRFGVMSGLLAHELRHVSEQYVLEFRNSIQNNRDSLNYDFKHRDPFSLDRKTEIYRLLLELIYHMSAEEQRAMMQATWNVCQEAIRNDAYRAQLTASYYNTMSLMYRNGLAAGDDNFRTEIISALRSNPLKYVHGLPEFRKAVNQMAMIRRPDIYKAYLILGYFLEKHGYIKNGNDADVREFFSEKSVTERIGKPMDKNDMPYYEIVFRIVRMNYRRYENIIYNIVGSNIERIFRYKSQNDNVVTQYSKMAADSDLKLKDYEVGLINESFNRYADDLERRIKGKPDV